MIEFVCLPWSEVCSARVTSLLLWFFIKTGQQLYKRPLTRLWTLDRVFIVCIASTHTHAQRSPSFWNRFEVPGICGFAHFINTELALLRAGQGLFYVNWWDYPEISMRLDWIAEYSRKPCNEVGLKHLQLVVMTVQYSQARGHPPHSTLSHVLWGNGWDSTQTGCPHLHIQTAGVPCCAFTHGYQSATRGGGLINSSGRPQKGGADEWFGARFKPNKRR